jgi:hypothetical protein
MGIWIEEIEMKRFNNYKEFKEDIEKILENNSIDSFRQIMIKRGISAVFNPQSRVKEIVFYDAYGFNSKKDFAKIRFPDVRNAEYHGIVLPEETINGNEYYFQIKASITPFEYINIYVKANSNNDGTYKVAAKLTNQEM